ncbi:hypothetical protein TBLA_0J00260 [Henningerozyma blattae CBS 6284]|uniref:RGS domain-containing protein n=1 Tax=Henningerozyma blattae (strain ATCC 34711 / CBS 6284 / DSM 70876 / NBRC 10599 / NRRL Y-10934 / UCD 77-7) TaxID=1071380 RepID=I2H9H4_HENB6|nr:hypothetical protein TBLA_0J00260 [Tetrapisispora blattae CBS 6284]CCH63026.1 hypothetical protein TBLA_0J00260 [Tetrapisispora blattae CBS 6284]
MNTKASNGTLHELSSKSFNRSSNGLIFAEDIKTVYSLLLICLDLKDTTQESKKLFGGFSKTYPYSFSLAQAFEKMNKLELKVDMNTTCISVSYSIKPELAHYLLKIFMSAKLLHTPADRTRSEPKDKVLLQPTAKGVCILQKYVRDVGLKKIPSILKSEFNSTKLFIFERNSVSDAIVHSEYLINILFARIMGPEPHIWSPNVVNEKLPTLAELLEYTNDKFTFENIVFKGDSHFEDSLMPLELEKSWIEEIPDSLLNNESRISPFAHRFFTNPDSDAHIQYYISYNGVRICHLKVFEYDTKSTTVEYSFTSKALWQWLMDCTDIIYPKEAASIVTMFLEQCLIVPIRNNINEQKRFTISRSQYCTFSRKGLELIQWKNKVNIKNISENTILSQSEVNYSRTNSSDSSSCSSVKLSDDNTSFNLLMDKTAVPNKEKFDKNPSLKSILKDPGMRYLFRRHLTNEFCVENLDAYIEIRKFLKQMALLKKIIDSKNNKLKRKVGRGGQSGNNIITTIESALGKQANQCLEMGYHLYSLFIMIGAPYQINIGHTLRESITCILLHPKSPLSATLSNDMSNLYIFKSIDADLKKTINSVDITEPPKEKTILSPNKFNKQFCPKRDVRPKPLNLSDEDNTIDLASSTNRSIHIKTENNNLSNTLMILKRLYPLLDSVGKYTYHLMKIDSLQKFIDSDIYKEASNLRNDYTCIH